MKCYVRKRTGEIVTVGQERRERAKDRAEALGAITGLALAIIIGYKIGGLVGFLSAFPLFGVFGALSWLLFLVLEVMWEMYILGIKEIEMDHCWCGAEPYRDGLCRKHYEASLSSGEDD